MYCLKCGYKLKDENYCPECGTKIELPDKVKNQIRHEVNKIYENGKIFILFICGVVSTGFIWAIIEMIMDLIKTPMSPFDDGRGWGIGFGIMLGFPIFAFTLGTIISTLYTMIKKYKVAIKNINEIVKKYPEDPKIKNIILKEKTKEKLFSIVSIVIIVILTPLLIAVLLTVILFYGWVYIEPIFSNIFH